jgi:hypothetical protein
MKERPSIMKLRHSFAVLAAALACSSFAGYTARLHFENMTRGQNGPGEIIASSGDQMAIKYSFHGEGGQYDKWGVLQITLCIDGSCCLPCDPDGMTWYSQVNSALVPPGNFMSKIFWECDWGPMYDRAIDPSGDSGGDFVCNEGLYALIAPSPITPQCMDFDATLFTWTAGCSDGYVNWMFDGRETATGLSTRLIDATGATVDITDNWVQCIPEPGSIAAIGVGLLGLLALRRRK